MGKSNLEDWETGHIIVVPRSFAKVSIKGEGDMIGVVLLSALPYPSGLRIKSAMTSCRVRPAFREGVPALRILP